MPSTTKSRYNALGPWPENPYFGVHTGFHLQGRWGPPPVMVLGEVGGVWGPGVLAGVLGPLAQGSLMQYKGIWGPGTPGPGVPGPLGPVKTVESRGPGVLGPLPGVLGPSQAILGPPEPLLASTGQYWPRTPSEPASNQPSPDWAWPVLAHTGSQGSWDPPRPSWALPSPYWPVLAQNPFGAGIKSAQS